MFKTEVTLYIIAYAVSTAAEECRVCVLFIPAVMIFLLAIILTVLRKRGVKSP